MVDSCNAVNECLSEVMVRSSCHGDLVLIHASLGHNLKVVTEQVKRVLPHARVLAASCCGVVGREGVSETMKDLALMAVSGREFSVAHLDGIYGHNSFECGARLAKTIKSQNDKINIVYWMASGIDIDNSACIAGIESVLGEDVTIVGATSSDNMKGLVSYQAWDGNVFEHGAFAVGFFDPTLRVISQASHGFCAVGDPLIVTRSSGHKILELNGQPAWREYTRCLGLPETVNCGDTIPIGALAEKLSLELAAEYGNEHILRVVTKKDGNIIYYPTQCPEGTKLWLTKRDEQRIFNDLDRMVKSISEKAGGKKPVAVFHADCLARGKYMFNRVLKEELVSRMQHPFSTNGICPPWLGMYGFGEFARLGGRNAYHNYTTAIYALFREA